MIEFFAERIAAGLARRAIQTPSQWAEAYRRNKDGSPFHFRRHPWSKGMHDSKSAFNVGQKAAQMTYTETALNVAFFTNDVRQADVLYVLPNQSPDASDFSKGRFDSAVEASPRLKLIYVDACNVGHKRAGVANFYLRGSQSRSGLKSVPVELIVLDELDEMNQDNVPLAFERVSGQDRHCIWMLSTPTLAGHGINKYFGESSQDHFWFPCPRCGIWTELTFPESLVIVGDDPNDSKVNESYLQCKECRGRLEHESKPEWLAPGQWRPSFQGREKRGFYVSQLYSPTVKPGTIATSFLNGRTSPADEQEFWNSKMGLPHETVGSRVSEGQLDAAKGTHINGQVVPHGDKVVTMGVDVGLFLHYEVCEWTLGDWVGNDVNVNSRPRVIKVGKTRDYEELDTLMAEYGVTMCVVDAQPDRRTTYQFSQRWWGRVKMCHYGQGLNGRVINERDGDGGEPLITVDRTSWLDQALGRFKNAAISLPTDVPHEYRTHLQAIVRIWRKDQNGNPTGAYVTPKDNDHYAHARCYAEIALALANQFGRNSDVESPL